MKRVFWLMSAVGLTFGQSSIAQSNSIQVDQVDYTNVDVVNIDDTINQLIARQSATPTSYTNQYSNASNLSGNYQSLAKPAPLTANSAPSIAAKAASRVAHGKSMGRCALYVRKALQSAGYEFTPNPSAYQYANGTLASAGFTKISNDNYQPQIGDVVVFNRTARNPHGHIQIYDGNQWVSDYRQPKFSPYSAHNGYTVWRDMRHADASADTGIMLALNEQ
ncbi:MULTISPECIES: CHAP domain-containing protein [unclassified Moraxella]|uniref:CHAP domain-containing protein n=1 Tax=unclassified Moraxella TaxID=2685852 RepID=UPI00359F0DCE